MEKGYEGEGRRRDAWWNNEASQKQIRVTSEDISWESKIRQQDKRDM